MWKSCVTQEIEKILIMKIFACMVYFCECHRWCVGAASPKPLMQIVPWQASFYSWSLGRRHSHQLFNNKPRRNAPVSYEALMVAFKGIGQPPDTAMTIAELLGFNLCLLWKLSVSVAAVLLVSWAYRFYSSRDTRKLQGDKRKPTNVTCKSWRTTVSDPNSAKHDTEECDEQAGASHTEDGLSSGNSKERAQKDTLTMLCFDGNGKIKKETFSHQEHIEINSTNTSLGSPLKTPHRLTEGGVACTTRCRSPHSLQNLEGVVGIRRELRQDLECQGAYSRFLSIAEIKVEDANMLLEGAGDQTVRRKIYDYYVESSSHCITESVLSHSDSQSVELRSCGSSFPLSPSSMTSITMHDLGFPQGTVGDSSSFETMKLKHPVRPVLLSKESYLSATEQCEFSVPLQTSRVTAAVPQSPPSNSSESTFTHTMDLKSENSKDPNERDMRESETVAESQCQHFSSYKFESNFLEKFKSKIDLGNCLEALDLAKKHGQTFLQRAALEVMSDNYLQVLREPNIYGWLLADERVQIQKQRMRGTSFVMVAHIDSQDCSRTFGGATTEKEQTTSNAIYYYDDHTDTWHLLCLIPQEIVSKASAVCTMDNYLFVAVGCHSGTTPSNRVFCFNPLTSIWKEISPMNEARPCCKLAALEGYVYAIGGERLSSVERYDPREDKWTFVAPLPNNAFAVAHQVTVSNGELYVSGGTFKCMLLCYSPKTNSWRSSLLVGSKDTTADMVAVRKCLYRFDINPILGLSVYRYHTGVRLWYKCSSKRLLRCPAFHCIPLDDTIFCVSHHFTMRFLADEISPAFIDEHLSVLSKAEGMLFPFVLSLPNKKPLQSSM